MNIYGLIGKNLGHSFSANYFNEKFQKERINSHYELFPLSSISEFPSLITNNPDLKGLNITIPYKQAIIPYLDKLSDEAKEVGAVNVIKFYYGNNGSQILEGYNSDVFGFKNSILPLLNSKIKNALILGNGGASKAVIYVLNNLDINVTVVSRTKEKGDITYDDLNEDIVHKNLLIVNTTPLGMFPDIDSFPRIPYQYLTSKHVCFDLVYNPLETVFLKKGKEMGATVKNGLEMLKLQADAAWEIWNR